MMEMVAGDVVMAMPAAVKEKAGMRATAVVVWAEGVH